MASFLAFIAFLLEFVRCTESVRQSNQWFGHKHGKTNTLFVAIQ
jgi:hypothetical protein